ncbi:hypothetical protein [Paracoccus haeundaensis]|uniref:hypothetical protein n=1 Tax=Paracoccus haeundaensis TaxID=225362 RepID=UPI003CCC4A1C|tara:strand:- start:5970 stop:6233 length:264 start_codon:yes stop_codon:yes gene_type:complete
MSEEAIPMTLLGGIGKLIGPVIGAGLMVTVIAGVVFMVSVLLFRRDLVGELYASRIGRSLGVASDTSPLSKPVRQRTTSPADADVLP